MILWERRVALMEMEEGRLLPLHMLGRREQWKVVAMLGAWISLRTCYASAISGFIYAASLQITESERKKTSTIFQSCICLIYFFRENTKAFAFYSLNLSHLCSASNRDTPLASPWLTWYQCKTVHKRWCRLPSPLWQNDIWLWPCFWAEGLFDVAAMLAEESPSRCSSIRLFLAQMRLACEIFAAVHLGRLLPSLSVATLVQLAIAHEG
jgi:hypothetical protein